MRIKGIKKCILSLLLVTVMLLVGMTGCRKSSAGPQGNAGSSDAAQATRSTDLTLIEGTEDGSDSSPDIALWETDEDSSAGYSGLEESYQDKSAAIDKHGVYTSKEDVALYIHTYGELPENFITKKEAKKLGWPGGSLEDYAPGKCIGGDSFGNFEGLLPKKKGRKYYECDIDTLGRSKRGAKRIIFSNDGLIYYTGDHYESFELLYGEE